MDAKHETNNCEKIYLGVQIQEQQVWLPGVHHRNQRLHHCPGQRHNHNPHNQYLHWDYGHCHQVQQELLECKCYFCPTSTKRSIFQGNHISDENSKLY